MEDEKFSRDNDPETSKSAGKRKRGEVVKAMELAALDLKDFTWSEAAAHSGHKTGNSPWRRVTTLRRKGLIERTGEDRLGVQEGAGNQNVYRKTDKLVQKHRKV